MGTSFSWGIWIAAESASPRSRPTLGTGPGDVSIGTDSGGWPRRTGVESCGAGSGESGGAGDSWPLWFHQRPPLCEGSLLLRFPCSPPSSSFLCLHSTFCPVCWNSGLTCVRPPPGSCHPLLPTATQSPWPGAPPAGSLRLCEACPSPAKRPVHCLHRVADLWVEGLKF